MSTLARAIGVCAVLLFFLVAFTPLPNRLHARFVVREDIAPADAIVVLGAGANRDYLTERSLRRALHGIRMFHRHLAPLLVLHGPPQDGSAPESATRAALARDLDVPASAIVLRRVDGAYTLQGRARQDDGSQADTDWVPLTRGPHRLEVDWIRASGPDAKDGRFRFWLDGMLVGDLTGLDNNRQPIEFVRLGALSVKGAAAGPLRFDHFQANRMSAPPAR